MYSSYNITIKNLIHHVLHFISKYTRFFKCITFLQMNIEQTDIWETLNLIYSIPDFVRNMFAAMNSSPSWSSSHFFTLNLHRALGTEISFKSAAADCSKR